MDKKLFETWLREVAVVKQVKLATDPVSIRHIPGSEPAKEWVVDHVLPKIRSCEFCNQSCSGCLNHTYTLDKKTYKKVWATQCDTCKKKVDLATKQVIENPNSGKGVYYVNRGLRHPKPGNKLGRPRKDFWNEPVQVFSEEQAQEQRARHADMLDRLAALRNK